MASPERQSRHGRRICPEPDALKQLVEIRPKRTLRIKCLNHKVRDEKFEKEMQAYLQFRESVPLGGPPRLKAVPPVKNTPAHGGQTEGVLSARDQTAGNEDENHMLSGVSTSRDANNHSESEPKTENSSHVDKNNTGWVSKNTIPKPSVSRDTIHSPSRHSLNSAGVQSVSEVQMTLKSPDQPCLNTVGENPQEEDLISNGNESLPQSAKSPRRTKGHRPISARSIRHGAETLATSGVSDTLSNFPDLDSSKCSHLDSPFKDVTLFFIHGVGGSSDVWKAQMDFFTSIGVEVIAPDLIGHGFSHCPKIRAAYHFKEILADLEAVFDKFCKKQNVVIGHSYGCAFAAALARRRQRRVTKLVLLSGGAPIPLAPQPGIFSLPICTLSCIRPCLFSRFEQNAFHEPSTPSMKREAALDVPIYVLSYMMQGQDWLDGDELYHQWISAPTLLLHGKYDKFVSLEEEQSMEEAIYFSRLEVIDRASHMVMMEQPREVNRLLYEFIFQEQGAETTRSEVKSRAASARSRARLKSSKKFGMQ